MNGDLPFTQLPLKDVAVSGVGGFVGANLAAELRERNWGVRRITSEHLQSLMAGSFDALVVQNCTATLHLAARAHVTGSDESGLLDVYRTVNRDMTCALARAACNAGVKRFIFLSSVRVNGSQSDRPFRVGDPPKPEEPYAISKFEAEQALWKIASETGLEVVIIRSPLVYGPWVKANFLRLLKLAASGLPLPLRSIRGVRSLVSIWNLCDLLIRCIDHPAAPGRTLFAGDGEDIALPELIRRLARGMGRPCRMVAVPPAVVRGLAAVAGGVSTFDKLTASLQIDLTETCRVLDWTPPVPLAKGLERTAQWYAVSAQSKSAVALG